MTFCLIDVLNYNIYVMQQFLEWYAFIIFSPKRDRKIVNFT